MLPFVTGCLGLTRGLPGDRAPDSRSSRVFPAVAKRAASDSQLPVGSRHSRSRPTLVFERLRAGAHTFSEGPASSPAPGDATRIAQSIIERLGEPFQLTDGNEISIGGSAGISLFPADGKDAATLLERADAALHAAKPAGRGTWRPPSG